MIGRGSSCQGAAAAIARVKGWLAKAPDQAHSPLCLPFPDAADDCDNESQNCGILHVRVEEVCAECSALRLISNAEGHHEEFDASDEHATHDNREDDL